MPTAPVTLEDFVLYHAKPSDSITEEIGMGQRKHKVTLKLPEIHGVRGLHEIIPHLWNFNVVIQGKDVTEDHKKTLFAASLQANARDRWNAVAFPVGGQVEDWTFRQASEAFVQQYLQRNDNA